MYNIIKKFNRKLIEDIMSECGDAILRIFHSNNLTYSSGMNFENLMDIIQTKNDPESIKVLNMVNIPILSVINRLISLVFS